MLMHGEKTESHDNHSLPKILTVKELVSDDTLNIPIYQRPYKWTEKNVIQLFSDIAENKDKSSYRLGTIVFHRNEGKRNIVDGQQRIVTLLLAVHALVTLNKDESSDRKELKEELDQLKSKMINPSFKSDISRKNIYNNYREICRIIKRSNFTAELIKFFLYKCEAVTFTLKEDISEAFQFFDSQNTRGLDLKPHDLLKAYHLREFPSDDEDLKAYTVKEWESSETQELARLFSQYLYRIRNWSKQSSARYFGKKDTELFKGVSMKYIARYPCFKQLNITHNFIDHYKRQYGRCIDGHDALDFPFNLDQTIINGRRFFEMISHYQKEIMDNYKKHFPTDRLDGYAKKIWSTINSYEGCNRTGDQYVKIIFDCLIIYYIDKFGYEEISRAVEKAFILAYSFRLRMKAVRLSGVDGYVTKSKVFKRIKDAVQPSDFINSPAPELKEKEIRFKIDEIINLFCKMGYYYE